VEKRSYNASEVLLNITHTLNGIYALAQNPAHNTREC